MDKMVKYDVDIKVLYNDLVVVELPENATREDIVKAANQKYDECGPASSEFGYHTFDDDTWTINRQHDNKYIGPTRSVEGYNVF